MRRLFIACLLCLLPVLAFANSQDNQIALRAWTANRISGVLDFSDKVSWDLTRPVVLKPIEGSSNVTVKVVGNGLWRNVSYSGKGYFLTVVDAKDCSLERIGIQVTNPEGSGFSFQALGSAGRTRLTNCYINGGKVGYNWEQFEEKGGSDNWLVSQCYANGTETGFRVVGYNSVAPWIFDGCVASGAKYGFDLTRGGAGAVLRQCGGSDTETVFRMSGGQSQRIEDAVTERAGTVLDIGETTGDPPFRFHASDLRDTRKAIARIVKSGRVELDFDHFSGANLIEVENKNMTTSLDLSVAGFPVTGIKNVGTGQVKCNGVVVSGKAN